MRKKWPYACIYQISHRASGKFYVGSTSNRKTRWRNHKTHSTCIHLRRAIAKYGVDEFDFRVVDRIADAEFTIQELKEYLVETEQSYLDDLYWIGNKKNKLCYNANPIANHGNFTNHGPAIDANSKEFSVVSPDDIRFDDKNIAKFAAKHDLVADCLSRVIRGERRHHKGWHLPGVSPIIQDTERGLEFAFISPQGEVYQSRNLSLFCSKHGLSATRMNLVLREKQDFHRGWKKLKKFTGIG